MLTMEKAKSTPPMFQQACYSEDGEGFPPTKPQRLCAGATYHAVPGTTLEIKINEHPNSPASSRYSASTPMLPSVASSEMQRRPAPAHLPPPPPPPQPPSAPPAYTSPSLRSYDSHRMSNTLLNTLRLKSSTFRLKYGQWRERLLSSQGNSPLLRVCALELLLSVLALSAGIWCLNETSAESDYCPAYHSAIWIPAICIVNSLLGVISSKIAAPNFYLAHLVISLICIALCVIGGALAASNWTIIGTYHHPKVSRDRAFCLMGEHDASRIRYIFSHMSEYNFPRCLYELKVGIAVNSAQFACVCTLALLFAFSTMWCMKRLCTTGSRR